MITVRTATTLLLFAIVSRGAGICAQGSAANDESNQAIKYHAALQKRPEPGYLFDRFYNAWLDQSTADSLQDFLQKKLEQADTTADRLLLAFFHSKQNNDLAAIEEFGKALKNDPTSATAWYYKAQAESRTLDFETAAADLKRARSLKPNAKLSVLIERQLGTMLLRSHQTKEAIGVWKSLLAANPDDDELREDIVELQMEEGLFQEAATLLESLIARTKDPYVAVMRRLRLGDIHHRSGQRQKAIEVYVSTLRESGHDTWLEREILAQIEQLFRAEDDLSGLKRQYKALVETFPKRIGLQRRRCRLLADLGEHDEAVKGYRAILELTPGDRGNREEYVDMLCRIGRHEAAVKELETLCSQNPKDAELQVRLAKTFHQAKQPAKAIEAVRQYLKISDQSEYVHLRAARLVESFGDKKSAGEFYGTMVKAFPDSPSAKEAHAVFLYANGRKEAALAIWKTLAQAADVTQTLSIARTLETRGEDAVVLELLKSRQKEFGSDPLFLGQLANTGLRLKQYEQAIPWGKRRVELVKNATELESAVSQVVTACQQADKADKLISELKSMAERPIPLTCLLAELLECAGDSKEADSLLRTPAEKGELLAVGEQIRLFGLRGEWAAAAGATRRLLELSGGRQSPYVRRLVELYERDGKFEDALKWVETWKRLSPGATTPWLTEARLLRMQGKESDVIDSLRKAIQRFEADDELRVQLAQAYQGAGRGRDAERVYWQLYEKTADAGDKLRWAAELAKLAQQEGTIPRLIDDLRQRIRNNRQSIVPLLAMAEVYRIADDYQNRRQTLLAATKIKPDDLQLLTQIARLEEIEGDWKAALSTLEQAAKLDKTDHTRQKIAQLHLEYGNRDTGFAMLRESLGEQIADPRVLERMADSLCGMQEWDRAVELLRNRIADHPGDYRLRYLLAVAHEELGHTSEAIAQFLALLDNQEELATPKKNAPQSSLGLGSYIDILRRLMPAEAAEWMQLQQYQYMTYSYRQSHQAAGYSQAAAAGLARNAIPVPPAVDAVRSYAMVHLLTLAHGLDEPQQAALVANLKTHGIRNPKPLLKLGIERNNGMPPIAEALDEYPDNESLLALFVFVGFQQQRTDHLEDLARAFKVFREKRPELAVMAAIEAASASSEYAKLLDEALVLAAKIEEPNPFIVMAVARSLGGQPWAQDTSASNIGKGQREKIVKRLVAWYPKLSQGNNNLYGPWAFFCVVGALRASDAPAAYFAMLDDEVARWRKDAGKQAKNQRFVVYHQPNASFLSPLEFPPQELADFPSSVCELLSTSPNSPYRRMAASENAQDWDVAQVEPLVQKIKDPTLRVLLAKRHELSKIVEATLQEMLAKKPPQLDAYLLAAGKASADSRFGDAIDLLEKSRQLPMKQEMRRRIDVSLVAVALAAKDVKGKESRRDDILKAGRDAALRLRRQRLDQQQREQLVAAFDDLGLKDEAKKLEKQLVTPAASMPASYAVAAAPVTPTSKERIEKLVASGNRDMALRLLANEVKSIGQQQIANPGNYQWYRQQMRELKTRITGLGMTDGVLKQFAAGESGNAVRLGEYAMACELFDREPEARKAYEQVLAARPKDDMARVRLLLLLSATKDSATAVENHLTQLSDAGGNMLGQMLAGSANDYEASWDERFRRVELAIRHLAKQKDRPRADVQWATQLVQAFGQQQHSNRGGGYIPSLFQRQGDGERGNNVDAKTVERRASLYRDLCLQMIDVPQLGRMGFQHLLAAAEARGDVLPPALGKTGSASSGGAEAPVEKAAVKAAGKDAVSSPQDAAADFGRYAEKVLLAEAQNKNQRGLAGTVRYSYDNSDGVRFHTPEEYLAGQAWRAGDWRHIESELAPKLKEGRNRQASQSLERLMKLYRCGSDEFLTLAKSVIKDSAAAMPMTAPTGSGLATVVDVWADRGLAVDLQPLILDTVRRNTTDMQTMRSSFPVRYLESLVAQGDRKRAEDTFDQVTTIYLGPAEKRAEFIRKNYQPNNYSSGSPTAKIQVYVNFLDQCGHRDSLVFLVLTQAEPLSEILLQRSNVQHRVRECLRRAMQQKPERVVALLESSPWLADLEQFRVLPLGQRAQEWPLVLMLRDSNVLSDPRLKPVWTALQEKQKTGPTFGRGLLLAVAGQQTDKKALLQFVEKHLDGIKKLPAKRQADLSAMVRELLPPESLKDISAGGPSQSVGQWIDQRLADRSSQLLDKLRNAKRIEDLGISGNAPWEVGQYLGGVLPDVIRTDSKSAQKMFWHAIALTEDAAKRGRMQHYFGDGQTLAGVILESMLQQHNGNEFEPKMLAFLIDLLAAPEGTQLSVNDWIVENAVQRILSTARRNAGSPREAMEPFYEELGKTLEGRPSTWLLPSLWNAINQQVGDEKGRQQLADWARQMMQKGKHRGLAADLYACIRLEQEKRQDASKPNAADPSPRRASADYHEHFQKAINDAGAPLSARLTAASFVADHEGARRIPLALAADMVRLYVAALEKGSAITSSQHRALLRVLRSFREAAPGAEPGEVGKWRELFASRYLQTVSTNAGIPRTSLSLNDGEALCQALQLYLAADDMARVNALLTKCSQSLSHSPSALASLVRYGKADLAARFFQSHWATLSCNWPGGEVMSYGPEIEANTAAFTAKLNGDGERCLAEVLLATMPDATHAAKASEKKASTRDERLVALAGRLKGATFTNPAVKTKAVCGLMTSEKTAAILADEVATEYKKILASPWDANGDGDRMESMRPILSGHVKNRLLAKDVQPFIETLEKLSTVENNAEYVLDRLGTPLLEACYAVVKKGNVPWTSDQSKRVAAALRTVMKNKYSFHFGDARSFVSLLLLAHVQAGQADDLIKWFHELQSHVQSHLCDADESMSVFELIRKASPQATGGNLQQRIGYVRDALRVSIKNGWFVWQPQSRDRLRSDSTPIFERVAKSGLMTPEELTEHGPAMVGAIDDAGLAKAALAAWLQARKESGKAAPLWQSAIAAAPDKKQQQVNYWRWNAAESLHAQGKTDEAKVAVAEVDENALDASHRASFQQFRAGLSPSSTPSASPSK